MIGGGRREHPRRRRLQVIRHVEPAEVLQAMTEPATGPLPAVNVPRETSEPGLSRAQVLRLEAATAMWVRQVRTDGPADATLLYAAPRNLPPVPPPANLEPATDAAVEDAAVAEASRRLLEQEEAHDAAQAADTARRLEDLRVAQAADEARRLEVTPAVAPRRVADWTSRHDEASRQYAVRDRLAVSRVPLADLLLPHGPILDQGTTPPLTLREASGCVGFAVTAAANVLGGHLGLADARAAYDLAQTKDEVAGESYAGTSVLAGMKAGQALGWWDTYLWALGGTRDVAQALLQLRSPVVIGIPWDSALEDPDASGVIRPGGAPAGGHALAVIGLQGRPTGWHFVIQQSRGPAEGNGGLVYLHHKDLANLLAGVGEAAVPITGAGQ